MGATGVRSTPTGSRSSPDPEVDKPGAALGESFFDSLRSTHERVGAVPKKKPVKKVGFDFNKADPPDEAARRGDSSDEEDKTMSRDEALTVLRSALAYCQKHGASHHLFWRSASLANDQEARSDTQLRRYLRTPGFELLGVPPEMQAALDAARVAVAAPRKLAAPRNSTNSFSTAAPPAGQQLGTEMATLRGGHAGLREHQMTQMKRLEACLTGENIPLSKSRKTIAGLFSTMMRHQPPKRRGAGGGLLCVTAQGLVRDVVDSWPRIVPMPSTIGGVPLAMESVRLTANELLGSSDAFRDESERLSEFCESFDMLKTMPGFQWKKTLFFAWRMRFFYGVFPTAYNDLRDLAQVVSGKCRSKLTGDVLDIDDTGQIVVYPANIKPQQRHPPAAPAPAPFTPATPAALPTSVKGIKAMITSLQSNLSAAYRKSGRPTNATRRALAGGAGKNKKVNSAQASAAAAAAAAANP